MEIPRELLNRILAHARAEAPNECCGVLAVQPCSDGEPLRAVEVHPATNTAASPLRFEIDGREVMRLIDAIEQGGCELGGIYHSHTRTAPYPSQTDINFAANWPGVEWVIVGLSDPGSPQVRSYLIEEGRVREVALEQLPPDVARSFPPDAPRAGPARGLQRLLGARRLGSARGPSRPPSLRLVKVAYARNLPEAEMIESVLRQNGIPSLTQRNGGFDVPDFLAAGPRDVLVPAQDERRARELLGS
jgi:[CysO sulfur-carrier protein]-S-L-cysteine hydrolase